MGAVPAGRRLAGTRSNILLSLEKQILYLTSQAVVIQVGELLDIYRDRGYSSQYVRNQLFLLKKAGYIETLERGSYRITGTGDAFVRTFNQKPLLFGTEWDGGWTLVTFTFPEGERGTRDRFRSHLQLLGFGRVHDSVYVCPWDHGPNLRGYLDERGLDPWVVIATGCRIPALSRPERIAAIWSLEEIAAAYRAKKQWFDHEFMASAPAGSTADERQLFIRFLELGEAISALGLIDPMLPPALLPADWPCTAWFQAFFEELNAIGSRLPAASRYAKYVRAGH